MSCVNISSKEFKDTAKRLDISSGSLENIVHEYMNTEGNENSFPSDSYILSKVEGQPFTEPLSEKAQKLIDSRYSKPIIVGSYEEAKAVVRDISKYFDSKHIGLKETLGGKYEVSLNTKVDPNFKETVSVVTEAEESTINIYAGTGENAELSNFAERPFVASDFGQDNLVPVPGEFNTVEGAFQAQKLAFIRGLNRYNGATTDTEETRATLEKLRKASGAEARAIGRNIKDLDTKAWDAASAEIMKSLIKESFKQNPEALDKLLATEDAVLTHTQDRGKWGTEFPKLLMEVREELRNQSLEDGGELIIQEMVDKSDEEAQTNSKTDENGLSRPEPLKVRPELSQFQDKTTEKTAQLNSLLNSGLFKKSEVRHIARQIVYYISDVITEFQSDPSKLFSAFDSLNVNSNGELMSNEERENKINEIKEMSRVQLVNYITPQRLIDYVKYQLFTYEGNADNLTTMDKIDKAELLFDNFDAVIWFANDAFTDLEKFTITAADDATLALENIGPEVDDFTSNSEDLDSIRETNKDTQEHWQIESRTQTVISSMSQLVRQVFNRLYQVRVNPETQEKEKILDEFGIEERVDAKDATSSILRWTQGAENLQQMIDMLKEKVQQNPWVEALIAKLEDTTGAEADFQSQFYGVFAKVFQPYSVVLREKNDKGDWVYRAIAVNQHPALTDAMQEVKVSYKVGMNPMFEGNTVKKKTLDTFTAIADTLLEKTKLSLEENDRAELVQLLTEASNALGYAVEPSDINLALDSTETFKSMVKALKSISDNLSKAIQENSASYDPFKYRGANSIGGYVSDFLTPITSRLEDTAVSSFYDSGKMYQSFVTPSYLTVMMNHFRSDGDSFQNFLANEYGQYSWFVNKDGSYRSGLWIETLANMSEEVRKDIFKHKVELNFNKHNYMKNMTDAEYSLSVLAEAFSNMEKAKGTEVPMWFRVPMESNKPSSEFIQMIGYIGSSMKPMLIRGFKSIFNQELSRIQTVEIRDYNKKNPNFIKNFDKNGKKFMMLDFLNVYLEGGKRANTELGKLIRKAINEGTTFDPNTNKGLTTDELARLDTIIGSTIEFYMDARTNSIISQWKNNGVFEGAKQITGIGTDDAIVEQRLREFIWNDTFAAMNILELTITDPAYYKDAEDLQKRLAQIHSPGIRANVNAVDYNGKKVSADGKFRTILLKDFDNFVSNIKDNLRIVFDRKIEALQRANASREEIAAARATYDNIIEQFNHINVADAQGYSSPTSYRKKAFLFGKWSRSAEEIYNKLKNGTYTYSDLQTAFQPLKPFVYGQIPKPSIDTDRRNIARPLDSLKIPVQFKNSEYLLIMADAILQGENTGKPNLLRAVYQVMEESADKFDGRGIDTVQFESTCKSGLMAPIDINQFYNVENGEALAKNLLESSIYNIDGTYNSDTYVYEVPFENYAIQQEVPEHFKDHAQAHGSQIRYIIPSDLESVDSEGNPVTYNFIDRGQEKQLTAEEFKAEYENNIALNINESIEQLSEALGITGFLGTAYSKKDRNIALSRILLDEVLRSPRYGVELAVACTVNPETGEFNTPLGDPIQSKRIEQLINSVIKNRINKQEIAGGPVVQVSNFGTSRELNIRFKDKKGGLLMTRAEFENSGKEGTFEDYIKENQAGIAYYEVFAPIFSNELFEKFADKDGNIDIETIERISPDLLQMIGYRIPTEDKYSMAPLKIVGFLPREAGEGIMLPNDITLLTGSDFDVDKFYLMRKEIPILQRFLGDMASITNEGDAIKTHRMSIKKALLKQYFDSHKGVKLPIELKKRVEERADILIEEELNALLEKKQNKAYAATGAYERARNEALKLNQDIYDRDTAAIEKDFQDGKISEEEYNSRMDAADAALDEANQKAEDKYQNKIKSLGENPTEVSAEERERITSKRPSLIFDLATSEQRSFVESVIENFLENPFGKPRNSLERTIKNLYIDYMFDAVEYTEGSQYRNNKIVDMSWAVLTNPSTTDKMLTPGGFDQEKTMGYMVSAWQNPANDISWSDLDAIAKRQKGLLDGKAVELDPNNDDIETGLDALKSLSYTEKNLAFIDTHIQFYKQNSAAATALGMAAVQKIAHAVLESNGYQINVSDALNLDEGEFFQIGDKKFYGLMQIDNKLDDEGNYIGRTLGEFVAMFADAVKDPVANLMNINNTTMPLVTTMIRFGMPFRTAALFISQPAIRRVLELYNSENITNFVRLSDVINRELKNIEKNFNVEEDSTIKELDTLTERELVSALNPKFRDSQNGADIATVTDYKVLKFFQYFDTLSKEIKGTTYATRFNSISSAVGPLVIDNLTLEYKVSDKNFRNFYDAQGNNVGMEDIFMRHPILEQFHRTLGIARAMLSQMPANSEKFREIITASDDDISRILLSDRKTLSELSDFFQSYLLVANGTIPIAATQENKFQGLEYYVSKFPMDFMKGNAKVLFKGNALIDAIKLDFQNNKPVLKVDTTGLDNLAKEKLSDGWEDLYNSGERGRKLAEHLFYYNFWRTGIGFSPKSFMGLFPVGLKNKIAGYNETYVVDNNSFAENVEPMNVLDQFVMNNADNNKVAPRVRLVGPEALKYEKDGRTYTFTGDTYFSVGDKLYIKSKVGGSDVLLKRTSKNKDSHIATFVEIPILGNNGEYFEAYTGNKYTPLNKVATITEVKIEGEVPEVSPTEAITESADAYTPVTPQEEVKRTSKYREMLIKAFQTAGRTREQAIAKLDAYKDRTDKKQFEKAMKGFLKSRFTDLGIEFNDETIEEAYEEMC